MLAAYDLVRLPPQPQQPSESQTEKQIPVKGTRQQAWTLATPPLLPRKDSLRHSLGDPTSLIGKYGGEDRNKGDNRRAQVFGPPDQTHYVVTTSGEEPKQLLVFEFPLRSEVKERMSDLPPGIEKMQSTMAANVGHKRDLSHIRKKSLAPTEVGMYIMRHNCFCTALTQKQTWICPASS